MLGERWWAAEGWCHALGLLILLLGEAVAADGGVLGTRLPLLTGLDVTQIL